MTEQEQMEILHSDQFTEDQKTAIRKQWVKISFLEDRCRDNDQLVQTLYKRNQELEGELITVRKSTMYKFTVFMQNNGMWITAILMAVGNTVAWFVQLLSK